MTSNYITDDPILGQIDLDDYFIRDQFLIDQFVGNGLWSMGSNAGGQLGLSDIVHRSSPTQMGSMIDWKNVYGSDSSGVTFATKTNGTLWVWGGPNTTGPFGNGVAGITYISSPVQVGSLSNWRSVASSAYGVGPKAHVVAVKTDGTLWSWGSNIVGQLGQSNITDRSSPVQVGTLTGWKLTSCGIYYSMAIKTDGTLWAWGQNSYGNLGLNNLTKLSSPVQVGSLTNWKFVACGQYSTVAVKTDGTLWAWGGNTNADLGLGNRIHRSSPFQVGSLTNWKNISKSSYSSLALKTDGTIWSWGPNFDGSLGLNDTTGRSSPVQVGSLTNWKQIYSGYSHCAAIKTDGTLWTWGNNSNGQLGDNSARIHRSSPVQVGSLTNWRDVTTGITSLASTSTTVALAYSDV